MSTDLNQAILDWIEQMGGGYVWEPEVFAITLLSVQVNGSDVERMAGLSGVKQIVVDAVSLSLEGLRVLACVPGLRSLVLARHALSPAELQEIRGLGPEITLIDDGHAR